ncbi:MAG: hypothetical protein HQL54_00240 [Magnetococcales bacterium]|nr:hypothetical protein [Magnetococcales bacterium]
MLNFKYRVTKFVALMMAGFCLFLSVPSEADAIEVAPRISDREIVESLTEIKTEMKAMQKITDQRFDHSDKRFDHSDKRMDDLRMDMNTKFTDLRETMLVMFGALVSLIIALFGYIAWDRRSMVKPLGKRLDIMEQNLERDFEVSNAEGSMPRRLLKALRELANSDEKLANVLRSFSLL